jgi:hypothetical protein
MPPLEDTNDVCVEYLVEGETLIVGRALNMYVKVDYSEGKMENIYHTRCLVHNKVCSLIIDGGSCTNVASTELVKKLNLHTTKHLIPYKLPWLNDGGEVKMNKNVLIAFCYW